MDNILEYIKNNSKISQALLGDLESQELELKYPTRKDESWKYFPVSKLNFSSVVEGVEFSGLKSKLETLRLRDHKVLVFSNGQFLDNLSDEISNVKILELEDLNFSMEDFESSLDYINVYTARAGYDIFVDGDEKVQIIHFSSAASSFLKNRITVSESAKASVHESFVVEGESLYSSYTEMSVAKEAKLNYYSQSQTETSSQLLINQHICVYESSVMNSLVLDTDPGKVRRRSNLNLLGEESLVDFKGFYLVNDKAVVNHKLDVNHMVPNCVSKQLFKGIIDGMSKVIFDGKVYVAEGAVGTDSEQLNKTTLLADGAELISRPQLEIYNDDVTCAHGATLGGFDADEVFYFQSRAISQEKAVQMMAYGFAEDIFQAVEDENVHESMSAQFIDRFSQYKVELNEL